MGKKFAGLFALGLMVVLTTIFSNPGNAAFSSEPPESDSAILARHIHDVKVEYAIEEFSEHSFNSHLTDQQLDSILKEDGITITGGSVTYAPDSSFKIFVVYGESCGAYCNPYNKSWLYFNDGSGYVINDVGFDGNLLIYSLPDGQYLIRDKFVTRDGPYSVEENTMTVVKLNEHLITRKPFLYTSGHTEDSFEAWQQNYIPSEFYVEYVDTTHQLTYQFANDLQPDNGKDSATIHTGYFQYTEGVFVHKKDSVSRIYVDME